ncbi:flagellar hook-basal body complex protein FliE [Hyphococcus sp.]|uniref:flagellar hook-basal body complex protein FliE n=1 Tax=Hyphococcus sp. TaxID=2038636 RepID=UPI003CCB9A1A
MKLATFQAAQNYNLAKSALKTENPAAKASQNIADASQAGEPNAAFKAVHDVAATIAKGETASVNYMTGKADPHSVVEALAAAELAVETAVTVRDKVVEAYQELIRMPV